MVMNPLFKQAEIYKLKHTLQVCGLYNTFKECFINRKRNNAVSTLEYETFEDVTNAIFKTYDDHQDFSCAASIMNDSFIWIQSIPRVLDLNQQRNHKVKEMWWTVYDFLLKNYNVGELIKYADFSLDAAVAIERVKMQRPS